jgi:hypothetical protein
MLGRDNEDHLAQFQGTMDDGYSSETAKAGHLIRETGGWGPVSWSVGYEG